MFSDVAATWNGVFEEMSDMEELVSELFYLPEMLTKENSIDFGTTQLGGKLDSVKLPSWAQNPVDFIHKHRMALESEHVSAHLHEWIDLIFGYKQRGKEAILANNMFFYITYEGIVDIDKISDPVSTTACYARPYCLFWTNTIPTSYYPSHEEDATFRGSSFAGPAAAIHASSDAVIIVDTNAPAAHIAQHKWQPNTSDGQGTPFLFQHGKPTASSAGGALIRMFKGPVGSGSDEWQFPQNPLIEFPYQRAVTFQSQLVVNQLTYLVLVHTLQPMILVLSPP
ncbi:hypothetical protein REPUB_Repub06bG0182200 [Reevesia pubescens]